MPPQSGDGGCFVVPLCLEAFAKEVINRETIATTAYFEVDPAIAAPSLEVVFFNEFGRDVGDFDADVFWVFHRRVKVEVFQVQGAEPGPFP